MYDSSRPSTSKKGYSEDMTYLPTAGKSQLRYETQTYMERTPERISYASPHRRSSRASQATKSIDQCIYLASQKKKMNQEAIGEVQQINNEILGSLTGANPARISYFEGRNRTAEPYKAYDPRQHIATSQFDWRPTSSIPTPPQEEYKHHNRENSNPQENADLRLRLNDEIRKNNDLMRYVSSLETEVSTLRASQVRSSNNGQVTRLMQENRQLRNQLASQGSTPSYLLDELEKLKAQNNALRKDTVSLLRAKQA